MNKRNDSAFFFDFDGVLLQSLEIKTNAYKQIFKDYSSDVISEIIAYHQQHAGISRVEKIDHAHKHIVDTPYSKEAVLEHVREYSNFVFEKVIKAKWVPGAKEFVELNYRQIPLFIVSGTPEEEMKEIVRLRDMEHYFREVHGSPTKKPDHIRSLVKQYSLRIENCFFIGDALTDYYAAQTTGMPFIGIQGEVELPGDAMVLPDCTGLSEAMVRLRTSTSSATESVSPVLTNRK